MKYFCFQNEQLLDFEPSSFRSSKNAEKQKKKSICHILIKRLYRMNKN